MPPLDGIDPDDAFSSVLEEVMSVKGKAAWSGPHNWAYLDMVSPAALADKRRLDAAKPFAWATDDDRRPGVQNAVQRRAG